MDSVLHDCTEDEIVQRLAISARTLYRRLERLEVPKPWFLAGRLTPHAARALSPECMDSPDFEGMQSTLRAMWQRLDRIEARVEEHHATQEADITELKSAYNTFHTWSRSVVEWLAPLEIVQRMVLKMRRSR